MMDRDSRLRFCKVCKHKKLDFKRGIICKHTDSPATFEDECVQFELITGKQIKTVKEKEKSIGEIILNEKISKKDLYLLSISTVLSVFFLRLLHYSGLYFQFFFLFLLLIIFLTALILRDVKRNRFYFFEDLKFRFILSLAIPVLNYIYVYSVYDKIFLRIIDSFYYFILLFLISYISLIFVKLYSLFIKKNLKTDENL